MTNRCQNANCAAFSANEAATAYCEDCRNFLCSDCADQSEKIEIFDQFAQRNFRVPVCQNCSAARNEKRRLIDLQTAATETIARCKTAMEKKENELSKLADSLERLERELDFMKRERGELYFSRSELEEEIAALTESRTAAERQLDSSLPIIK